jgi:ankyrin repeat protein
LWCPVCMRPVARRQRTAGGVACCVAAGGGAMTTEANEKLIDAARDGEVAEIAAALLDGADPNAVVDGWTPLLRAADGSYVAAIDALLTAGAHVDGADGNGFTPLMLAATYGCSAAVTTLLTAGADAHHANNFGHTALHWASIHGHVDAARVLLEAGARTDVSSKYGQLPADMVRAPACSLARLMRLRDCSAATLPWRRFA